MTSPDSSLYDDLLVASPQVRQEAAGILVGRMHDIADTAYTVYQGLVSDILDKEFSREPVLMDGYNTEAFSTVREADMTRSPERVAGFLKALQEIGRDRRIGSVVVARPGTTAFLAAVSGVLYPEAEIHAAEPNPYVAHCARRVLELLGFDDQRVHVTWGEVSALGLTDKADLGVTEAYGPAGTVPGLQVGVQLAEVAEIVVPRRMKVFAQFVPLLWTNDSSWAEIATDGWQRLATLDLAQPNPEVVGHIVASVPTLRQVCVYSGLYTEEEDPIVATADADPITATIPVGMLDMFTKVSPGETYKVRYPTGMDVASLVGAASIERVDQR